MNLKFPSSDEEESSDGEGSSDEEEYASEPTDGDEEELSDELDDDQLHRRHERLREVLVRIAPHPSSSRLSGSAPFLKRSLTKSLALSSSSRKVTASRSAVAPRSLFILYGDCTLTQYALVGRHGADALGGYFRSHFPDGYFSNPYCGSKG